jgi:hypothetical protein
MKPHADDCNTMPENGVAKARKYFLLENEGTSFV